MYPSKLKVLVYGATGVQAGPVVHQLLGRGHEAFVLTRDAAKAVALQAAGATIIVGDPAEAAVCQHASRGMDAVSLLVPLGAAEPLRLARQAVDAARAAGVQLLVWNTSGYIPAAPTGNPVYDLRLDLRAYLQASGLPHITLIPTVYAENLLGPWTAPGVAAHQELAYPVPAGQAIDWLPAADLGALTVAALERPQLAGQTFVVGGAEALTGPALAEAFSAGLNRPISYRAMPPREFYGILAPMMGPGLAEAVTRSYELLWAGQDHFTQFQANMPAVLRELPVTLTPLREWAAQHAAAFSPTVSTESLR
ncbi:SDR family oxidoreductase [Hymenobacter terrenus]|uniref:SDR family oxidoreductase n=1 Tax=Hymenobacter terrenus TaxID=1629124 RepID=UPI000619C2C4|nr:NmrA family NAD(P)-binding protein [Hymenobacter terrenus]